MLLSGGRALAPIGRPAVSATQPAKHPLWLAAAAAAGANPAPSASSGASAPPPRIVLIASDVDGTLLDPRQKLSPRVAAAARAAATRAGVPLIVATGKARGPWAETVLPALYAAGAPAAAMPGVFLQGLLVADASGRTLWSRALEEEALLAAVRLARGLGLTLAAYAGGRILAERADEHTDRLLFYGEPAPEGLGPLDALLARGVLPPVQKVIFMGSAERADAARAEIEAKFGGGGGGDCGGGGGARGSVTTALPGMVELLPPGASKGAGLRWLLDNALPPEVERAWRRRQEEGGEGGDAGGGGGGGGGPLLRGLLAMGDGENDLEMLRAAEWPVAMGNACAALKGAARAVVASNAADGAAEAIERFVLAPRGLTAAGAPGL